MFGLGPWELTIVLVVLVFFFGGKRLGDLGEGLGKSISEFKKAVRPDASKSSPEARESPADGKPAETRGAGGTAGVRDEPSSRKEEEKLP